MKILWEKAKQRWKKIAAAIGNFQARALITLFYFLALPAFAVIYRIVAKSKAGSPGWVDSDKDATIEEIKKQW